MGENNDLKEKLYIIKEIMNEKTMKPSNDFVDDYIVYESILHERLDALSDGFWDYFSKNYHLPDVSNYFDSTMDTLHAVYNECIRPFYLRLDVMPDYGKEYTKTSILYSFLWSIKRWITNYWISIAAFIFACIFFLMALVTFENNMFLYDLFMSFGTGFSIAVIISMLNYMYKKQMRRTITEMKTIFNGYDRLKKEYDSLYNNMLDLMNDEKEDFVTQFCMLNNELDRFIKHTKTMTSIKTSSIYHRLIDFEKKIFEYSSTIVRKDFIHDLMDQTTNEEMTKLQIYIIYLGYWLNHFDFDLASLRYHYDVDITRMSDKQL